MMISFGYFLRRKTYLFTKKREDQIYYLAASYFLFEKLQFQIIYATK